MEEEYEKFTATTLIYANGARITAAAGTEFYSSNVIYNSVPCHIYPVHGTLAMSQTFGGLWRGPVIWFCVYKHSFSGSLIPSLSALPCILGGFGGGLDFGTA